MRGIEMKFNRHPNKQLSLKSLRGLICSIENRHRITMEKYCWTKSNEYRNTYTEI